MKKVGSHRGTSSTMVKKFNKALSVLLAAAMVAGMMPDAGLMANAAEAGAEAEADANVDESVSAQSADDAGDDVSAAGSDDEAANDNEADNGNYVDIDNTEGEKRDTGSDNENADVNDDDNDDSADGNDSTGANDNHSSDNGEEAGENTDRKEEDTTYSIKEPAEEEMQADEGIEVYAAGQVNDKVAWTLKLAKALDHATVYYAAGASAPGDWATVSDTMDASDGFTNSGTDGQVWFKIVPNEGYQISASSTPAITSSNFELKGSDGNAVAAGSDVYYVIVKDDQTVSTAENLTISGLDVDPDDNTVTIAATESEVTVTADNTVKTDAEYKFSVTKLAGYTISNIEVYKTDDSSAEYAITPATMPTEDDTAVEYTIAAGVIKASFTIKVTTEAEGSGMPEPPELPEKEGKKVSSIMLKTATAEGSASSIGRGAVDVFVEGTTSDGEPYNEWLEADNGWKLSDLEAGAYLVTIMAADGSNAEITAVTVDGMTGISPVKKGNTYTFPLSLNGAEAKSITVNVTAKAVAAADAKVTVSVEGGVEDDAITAQIKLKNAADKDYKSVDSVKLEANKSYVVKIAPKDKKTNQLVRIWYSPTGGDARLVDGVYYVTFTSSGDPVEIEVGVSGIGTAGSIALDTENSNAKLVSDKAIEYATSQNATEKPQTLQYQPLIATKAVVDSGLYTYVRVKKIDGTITVNDGYDDISICKEDASYYYYDLGQISWEQTVAVQAAVKIFHTENADGVENVEITPSELKPSTRTTEIGSFNYGGSFNVKVTMKEGYVLTGLTVNRKAVTDIAHSTSGGANVYTAEEAVKNADGSVDIQIKTAKKSSVTFAGLIDNSDNPLASVTYGLSASKADSEYSIPLDFNGTIYFKVTPETGKAVTKVEAITLQADAGDDAKDGTDIQEDDIKSCTELTASQNVYSTKIEEDTIIRVTTDTAYNVTVAIAEADKENVTGYAWSLYAGWHIQ